MFASFEQISDKAAVVRHIELQGVLQRIGATVDKDDSAKWHTSQGIISVTGLKFFNWTKGVGGGGAIDLPMHLENVDFIKAVCWLANNTTSPLIPITTTTVPYKRLVLPQRNHQCLPPMIRYLTSQRCLCASLVRSLINAGNLYADGKANAVFLLLGKAKTIVGAEIRGTNSRPWHALAPGSRKDLGCFYLKKSNSRKIVICESAIDAISYHTLYPDCVALSTAGATPNPPWLPSLIKKGVEVFCGYDADKTGDALAEKMIALYPSVKRLRPVHNDWNDVLTYSQKKSSL